MTPPETSALLLFLNRLARRSQLGEEERRAVLALPGQAVQVRANRDFVKPGESVGHACLIVAGLVGRYGQNGDGQRQISAIHIPGDMADLHGVVRPIASSALQALTTTTLIRIPHPALIAIARKYPALAEAFWCESVRDAAILSEWVVNVGRRNALSRTAHLICEMGRRFEQIGQAASSGFAFPVTQTQLADALGLTPVHVNRTLKMLKDMRVAEMKQGHVAILDRTGLARLGDFDAAYLELPGEMPRLQVA